MKRKPRRRLLLVCLLLAALLLPGFYNGLTVRHYTVDAAGIGSPLRIVLITDLHSCEYGEGETELLRAIEAQRPDLVVLAGDIFDDQLPDENTAQLLAGIGDKYPCYYVTGNHEYWSGRVPFLEKMALLERYGVKRLSGERVTVTVRGETLDLCGVDDPESYLRTGTYDFPAQLERVGQSGSGRYTILLSHRPESFELYARYGFDLVLCGHAHGGQWRIPGLLNGLFAPDQGLFPKYAGGEYRQGDTTMIVSRGLARESTPIPRFYNPPELVVIDLT